MGGVLSQDEVDSLLEGINGGSVQTETKASDRVDAVEVYDFTTQAGPIHLRLPGLGIINERFVGLLRNRLSIVTRSIIDVNLVSIASVKFSEFSSSLPLPASLNIFKMDPLKGFCLLVLEGSLVFSFVDTFFGGNGGSHVKLEGRGFTSIETKIIEKVSGIILESIENAWSDVYKIKTVYSRMEMDPQFTSIATPEDVVVVTKFKLDIENLSRSIAICMPYANIEPIREQLRNRFHGEKLEVDQTWKRYIEKKIKEMSINLSCTLGTAKITGRELLEMNINDVIPLEQKVGDTIIVNVNGIQKFEGQPGSYKNNKAVRIIKNINKE